MIGVTREAGGIPFRFICFRQETFPVFEMHEELNVLIAKTKQLENELLAKMREGRQKYGYEVRGSKVVFEAAVAAEHRELARSLACYLREAKW